MSATLKAWVLASRPKTLFAAVAPVLLGSALAFSQSKGNLPAALAALFGAICIQIATNLANDYWDAKKGADTADRLGPTRVTSSGMLSGGQVITGAFLCLAAAAILAVPLVLRGGWPILALGIISLFLAYAYTGGPFPLAYLGLGEIFVVLFFGLFAVSGTFYLNLLEWSYAAVLAGLQIGLHSSVLLAVNNLRDLETDRAARKRTLAARFGLTFARRETAVLVMAPFALGFLWLPLGFFWALLLPLMTLPLAWWLARACLTATPDRSVNQLLAQAAALHALFGLLLALGFLLP